MKRTVADLGSRAMNGPEVAPFVLQVNTGCGR
jgi:hypothetical protein